jgi:membrane protein YdbS with pleckstrin-like domain
MVKTLFSSFVVEPPHTKFEGEDNGEKVLYIFRKALITNVGWMLLAAAMLLVPAIVNALYLTLLSDGLTQIDPIFAFRVNALWYLLIFGLSFERFLNWYFNVYIITNKRLVDMDFYHLLSRKVTDAPLSNVEEVSYDVQGILESFFNYGDVIIQTAAERPNFEFLSVSNPSRVQDIISDLVKEAKDVGI